MSAKSTLTVNGFHLPTVLANVIKKGSTGPAYWGQQSAISRWYSMFDADEIDAPQIYPEHILRKTNLEWLHENREIFIGLDDGISQPGRMNPNSSLIFGELGQDALLALEYSTPDRPPSVSYLKWHASRTMRWAFVTTDIEIFLLNLNLI